MINCISGESEDKSTIDKNFKKKTGKEFYVLDSKKDPNIIELLESQKSRIIKEHTFLMFWVRGKHRCELIFEKETNNLAGYVCVDIDYIRPLYVFEEYRGYGISNILVKDSIEKYGAKKLAVYLDNEVAIRLYKNHGFIRDHIEDPIFDFSDNKLLIMKLLE
jgi:ribosomal protein S18 acetylase RimI-like enzyme